MPRSATLAKYHRIEHKIVIIFLPYIHKRRVTHETNSLVVIQEVIDFSDYCRSGRRSDFYFLTFNPGLLTINIGEGNGTSSNLGRYIIKEMRIPDAEKIVKK
jgi:hypothetical protein